MEGGLQVAELTAFGGAFDGLDHGAVGLCRQHQTAAHDLAIETHRAGAANTMFAADMAPGQFQLVAQEINQGLPCWDTRRNCVTVDRGLNLEF